MKSVKRYIPILVAIAMMVNTAGCTLLAGAGTTDLMREISPNAVTGKAADAAFTEAVAEFSIDLLKQTATGQGNTLISPLSVMLALAMTANGADNETLAQMQRLLGGDISVDALNEYLYSYLESLPNTDKAKLSIANSIWLRDNQNVLRIAPDFLQTNADYYHAAAYRRAFDSQTVREINQWVKTNTNKMIDQVIDEIDESAMMYLINAVLFDAEWQSIYYKASVKAGDFTDINGVIKPADFMRSDEYSYLDDGMATGFLKPYDGGRYSFAALLPNEGVPIESYLESLTGAAFLHTIENAQHAMVITYMPKFAYGYSADMNDALITLGIPDAFDRAKADFGKMGTSPEGPLYIGQVLHKAFISVSELGTKAGAVTVVQVSPAAMLPPEEPKIVRLDRPFVYAIIDNETNLPIFIGTLMTT